MKERTKLQMYRYTIGLLPRSRVLYKLCHIYIRHYFGFNYGIDLGSEEIWIAAEVLRKRVDPVVFDVGANIGQWISGVLNICPNAYIHAFEPSKQAFNILLTRVRAPHIHFNNFALGKKRERLLFYDRAGHPTSTLHRGMKDTEHNISVYPVDVVSLTEYCHDHGIGKIDFLKIDTEGHDFWVLQGAEPFLKEQRIGVIQFEYGPANIDSKVFLWEILTYLQHLPYVLFRLYPNYLLRIEKYNRELENFISVNYILIAQNAIQQYQHLTREKIK